MRKHLVTLLLSFLSTFIALPALADITLVPLASGLTLPVDIANAGDGTSRMFIVEQGGRIRIIQNSILLTTPFLDLTTAPSLVSTGGERGLLGLAFHPNYAVNGQFFVYFTGTSNAGPGLTTGDIVIARYVRLATDPNRADPASRVNILTIPHSSQANHNGGSLRFGPDGFLYAGVGDGGGGGDPLLSGQNLNTLLGKILRLNIDIAAPYIPTSNPFRNVAGTRPEIWAYGLRNPWRISFDRANGDLYIGDVGQGAWEEIDLQAAGFGGGANYGWNFLEGNHCFSPQTGCNTNPPGYVPPIIEYSHSEGNSITGGYVYRGLSTPDLAGKYVFGDFSLSKLWHATTAGANRTLIAGLTPQVSTFGESESGELYLANYSNGTIYSFSSSTDNVPDRVEFFAQANVPVSNLRVSNLVRITGIAPTTPISIVNGEYTASTSAACSNSYTTAGSTITSGTYICVRHTSASAANTPKTTTLNIGTASFAFTSTTQAGPPTFTVTPSIVGNGFISPNTPQQVTQGQSVPFTITPQPGNTVSVGGTCGGTLNVTNYNTNAITADCTVIATFTPITFAVTPSAGANGSIVPGTVQNISQGGTATFTVTPNAGYAAAVGGTCGGTLVGTTYTTNAITASCTVNASFTFIPVAPGAPTIGSAIPGDGQASISFTPPASDGGAAITSFQVTCNPSGATATGPTSPITVTGLPNNGLQSCSVTATNSVGTGPASATVDVTPNGAATLTLVSVKSRKTHGAAIFDLPINTSGPLTIEPRMIGAGHTIVFEFNVPVTAPGTASALDALAAPVGATSTAASGNEVIVALTGIADNQRITLTLIDVNAPGFTTSVPVGFLVGDFNASQSVNASDISAVKARVGEPLNAPNYLFDVNASGGIDATDVSASKSRSAKSFP